MYFECLFCRYVLHIIKSFSKKDLKSIFEVKIFVTFKFGSIIKI
jgi:hypothetical protein